MFDIRFIELPQPERNIVPKPLRAFFDAGRVALWNDFIDLTRIPQRTVDEPMNEYFFRLSRMDHYEELVEAIGFTCKETLSPLTDQKLQGITHILARTLPNKTMEKIMSGDFEMKDIAQTAYFIGYIHQLVVSLAATSEFLTFNKDSISESARNCIKDLQSELRKKYDIRPLIALADLKPT